MCATGRTLPRANTRARKHLSWPGLNSVRACLVVWLLMAGVPVVLAQSPDAGNPAALGQAAGWLSEKERLIASLEGVDIQTSWFTLPGVAAYDEQAARLLLQRLRQELTNNQLSSPQLEALARLTIQERALAGLLPEYTGVLASISDPSLDALKVILGFGQALDTALGHCATGVCPTVQIAAGRIVGRLACNNLALLMRTGSGDSRDWSNALQASDAALSLIQQGLDQGQPLASLLADPASEAAATRALLSDYLRHTQTLLDQGIHRADLTGVGAGDLPIKGDTQRAERLITQLVDMARFEKGDALSRRNDFQREVDLPRTALEVSELATLTPAAAIARAVSLEARIEHTILRFTLIGLNGKNLSCVTNLATQASQRAFDPTQPIEPCQTQGNPNPELGATPSAEQQPALSVEAQWQAQVAAYRGALEQLVQVLSTDDEMALERALETVMAAEADLGKELGVWQRIAFASPQAQPNDLALTRKADVFALRSLALYLSAAEVALAHQTGSSPQADAQQAAQLVSQALDEAVAAALQVAEHLNVQTGLPVIQDVVWHSGGVDGDIQIDVTIRNVGVQVVDGAQLLAVLGGIPRPGQPVPLIAPGQERRINLSLPASRWITLQLRSNEAMPDIWLGRPAVRAGGAPSLAPVERDSTLASGETPQSAPPSARPASWLLWCLPLAILTTGLAFAVALGLLIWMYRRARHPW